jgi:aspartate aminotransferase
MALYGCCDTGDEVLVFEPFYSNYHTLAALADVELQGVPTQIEDGFHLPDREVIEQHINPKTKAILISNPNNPTGTVYTREELQMLVEIAVSHDLFLISDEVYREFSFTGSAQPTSILSFISDHPDRLILTDSLSKRYNMCGARLGVLVTMNPDLFAGAYKIAQSRLSSGLVDQMAGTKQAEVPALYLEETNAEYERRRDALYDGLSAIPGVTVPKSEGAFYTMAHLPVEDSEAFCIFMLKEYRSADNKTVMLAPGSGFYLTPGKGSSEVRIAYVLSVPKITEAVEMIREGLAAFTAQA